MNQDELVWEVINYGHCSFKAKLPEGETFCRNPYNVTGQCNRSACPLANSRYATLREDKGRIYLYVKTPERAHTPKFLWERVKLSKNYTKALEQVDKELEFFPKFLSHRNKQRLTKIHQYLVRMRKLSKQVQPRLVAVNPKVAKRERKREAKALKAAKLERSIEGELLERLKSGVYGDIYNFPEADFNQALDGAEKEAEDNSGEEEEESEEEGEREFVEDFEWEEEDEDDMEDLSVGGMGLSSLGGGGDGFGASVFSSSGASTDPVGGTKRSRKTVSFGGNGDDDDAPAPAAASGGSDKPRKPKTAKRRRHISLGASAPVVEVEYEQDGEAPQLAR